MEHLGKNRVAELDMKGKSMSTQPENSFQNRGDELQKKSFIQRYLQSPLLISWTKLSTLLQSAELSEQTELAEAQELRSEVYLARIYNAPTEGLRVHACPSLTNEPIYTLFNGDEVTVFLEPSLEQQLQWVQIQFGFEPDSRGWVAAEVLTDWEFDRLLQRPCL